MFENLQRPYPLKALTTLDTDAGLGILATSDSVSEHTGLLSIPTEVRLKIHYLVLSSIPVKTLRLKRELVSRISKEGEIVSLTPRILDISELLVCRKFCKEAIEVFYGYHTFHYSMRRDDLWKPPEQFKRVLPLIKKLSLDFIVPFPRTYRAGNADARIAVHLGHIKDHCPGLKTLHLHILANQELQETFEPLIRNNETASALRQLLPRLNHLVIITFGPDDLLHEFRDGITNENPKTHHWAHEEFLTWPSITMSEWEVAGMKARKDRSGPSTPSWARSPHIERIHGFHLCKAGHLQAMPGTKLWANRNGRTWCDVPGSQLPVWVDYGLIECPRW